jgi:hypothetical protein
VSPQELHDEWMTQRLGLYMGDLAQPHSTSAAGRGGAGPDAGPAAQAQARERRSAGERPTSVGATPAPRAGSSATAAVASAPARGASAPPPGRASPFASGQSAQAGARAPESMAAAAAAAAAAPRRPSLAPVLQLGGSVYGPGTVHAVGNVCASRIPAGPARFVP